MKFSEIGFGLTARYRVDSAKDVYQKYGVIPFFRYYFLYETDKSPKGMYFETFLKFFGGKDERYYYNFDIDDRYTHTGYENFFEMSFGLGLGFKHVSNSGLVLDFNVGGGRTFGIYNKWRELSGRGCVLIGYRF